MRGKKGRVGREWVWGGLGAHIREILRVSMSNIKEISRTSMNHVMNFKVYMRSYEDILSSH